MKLFDFPEKLSIMDKLIRQEHTGTPSELAERLSISRSTLYEVIDELVSRGVEIKYSRTRRTFYYNNNMILDIRFAIIPLTCSIEGHELRNFSGGSNIFSSVLFSGLKPCTFAP
jgi:biotin operon repressor